MTPSRTATGILAVAASVLAVAVGTMAVLALAKLTQQHLDANRTQVAVIGGFLALLTVALVAMAARLGLRAWRQSKSA